MECRVSLTEHEAGYVIRNTDKREKGKNLKNRKLKNPMYRDEKTMSCRAQQKMKKLRFLWGLSYVN